MAIKLIGVPMSACTRRPLLVLAEKGVTDFTLTSVPWAEGETKVSGIISYLNFDTVRFPMEVEPD
jgi:glutathione S-transferase